MNPRLVMWDYGKEINITLTDALLSLESLRFMLGGAIKRNATEQEPIVVHHTEEVVCIEDGKVPLPKDRWSGQTLHPKATEGHPIRLINLGGSAEDAGAGLRTQIVVGTGEEAVTLDGEKAITFVNPAGGAENGVDTARGDHIRIFWDEVITSTTGAETAVEVTISPDTFPGTYKIVGDTFMRSEKTGKDEPFQFIINKAKQILAA